MLDIYSETAKMAEGGNAAAKEVVDLAAKQGIGRSPQQPPQETPAPH